MAEPIPGFLRTFLARRAAGRCEYCLLHTDDSFVMHQVDHIISRKHGRGTGKTNLALVWITTPLTEIGEVTIRLLKLNERGRLAERKTLAKAGRYPR